MADVRDFGAAGDGQVDDTGAIQHALDQRAGHLVFSPGTYRLTSPLVADLQRCGPLAIDGSGGTAKLVMQGRGPAIRVVGNHEGTAAPESVRPPVWQSERLPTISAIEIVGDNPEAVGIELGGTMQATIAGVSIRRCRYGVHLIGRNRNLLLSHSHIYDGQGAAIGVYFDGVNLHQAILVGCHISYQRHAGVKVRGGEVRNFQITGCDIEYNHDPHSQDSADVWIDAREGTIREGTIASNTIQALESPNGANVRIEGPDDPTSKGAGLWTIVGNILQSQAVNLLLRHCRGVAVTGNSFASGFERSLVIDRCRHVSVGMNTFDHNPDYGGGRTDGISIRGSAGISLAGLIVEASSAGSAEKGGAIEVEDSWEISIHGCQVLDPVHRGLDLRNVRNSQVAECMILDRREARIMREAIRVRNAHADLRIAGNLLGEGTEGSLVIDEGAAIVSGNVRIGS